MLSGEKELKFEGKSPIGSSYVKINKYGEIAMNITDGTYYASKDYDEAGILVSGEEENALTREEIANKVSELETLVNSYRETIETMQESISNNTSNIANNTTSINTIENNVSLNSTSISDNKTSISNLTNKENANNIFLKTYPVGSIYISTTSTNPGEIYGGTWERYANGKTLVGVSESETEFVTVNKTGGAKTHTLTINEIPSHEHLDIWGGDFFAYLDRSVLTSYGSRGRGWQIQSSNEVVPATKSISGSQAHNNLQPYITVYMWKRTA